MILLCEYPGCRKPDARVCSGDERDARSAGLSPHSNLGSGIASGSCLLAMLMSSEIERASAGEVVAP